MPLRARDDAIDATWQRLEDQIDWYDSQSTEARRAYQRLKVTQIGIAALIPFLAGFQGTLAQLLPVQLAVLPNLLIAALGIALVVFEGLQHLNQYQHYWLSYRSTCEALKHEMFLFLADAGPYADLDDTRAHLAERVEELISRDHAKWVAGRRTSRGRAGGLA